MKKYLSLNKTFFSKMPYVFLAYLFAIGLLTACSEKKIMPLFGTPTQITKDESPHDVICRIQQEFRDLPKPLMVTKSYIPSWTSRKFGAASVEHSGFYKIKLTQAGLDFLTTHSRLELVASLKPLFTDPDIGGEAAVLLAGMPVGDRSQQAGKTKSIANAIDKLNYLSPTHPRDWFKDPHWHHPSVWGLYGRGNKTVAVEGTPPINISGTLEGKILEVLPQLEKIPYKLFEPPLQKPELFKEELIDDWLASNSPPTVNSKIQQIINNIDSNFAALVLYPLVSHSPILDRNQILMMYLLDIQEKYWPILLHFHIGLKSSKSLRNEFNQQLSLKMSQMCAPTTN